MSDLFNILSDESGQGMLEYGLIAGIASIVAFVSLSFIGGKIAEFFRLTQSAL